MNICFVGLHATQGVTQKLLHQTTAKKENFKSSIRKYLVINRFFLNNKILVVFVLITSQMHLMLSCVKQVVYLFMWPHFYFYNMLSSTSEKNK